MSNKEGKNIVANIFGDDSESESDLADDNEDKTEQDETTKNKKRIEEEEEEDEDEIEDIETALDDADDDQDQKKKKKKKKSDDDENDVLKRSSGARAAEETEEEEEEEEVREERKGEPMHLIAALCEDADDAEDERVRLEPVVSKATNIFDVCAKKFDEDAFVEEEDKTIVDEFGRSKLKAKEGNVVRWMKDLATDEMKSNAKFVEWSDGSRTLHLGAEVFNVTETAVSSKQGLNQFVFARHAGLMEGKAKISKRMQFRPATTDSHTHKTLRDAIEKKHGAKAKGTMRFVSNVDPEKEKDASDKLNEQRARDEAMLERKRKKMMSEDIRARADGIGGGGGNTGRYGGGNRSIRGVANELYYDERSRREAELDAEFLEEGVGFGEDEHENDDFIVPDDDDDDDDNSEDDDDDAGKNSNNASRKKRTLVDSDSEDD